MKGRPARVLRMERARGFGDAHQRALADEAPPKLASIAKLVVLQLRSAKCSDAHRALAQHSAPLVSCEPTTIPGTSRLLSACVVRLSQSVPVRLLGSGVYALAGCTQQAVTKLKNSP